MTKYTRLSVEMVHGRFMQDLEDHHICRQEVPQYKP